MDQFIPKRPLNIDYYDERQSLIPIRKSYVDLHDQQDSLIPITKPRLDLYYEYQSLIPVARLVSPLYDPSDSIIPISNLNLNLYNPQNSRIPVTPSKVDSYDERNPLIPQPLKSTSQYETILQTSDNPYDRSYIGEIGISDRNLPKSGVKTPIKLTKTSLDIIRHKFTKYDFVKDSIPLVEFHDNYKERSKLIPVVKTQSGLTRKGVALIKMKPWLASLRGVLPLPPVLSSLAPNLLLPPEFGMVARRVDGLIANPTPLNLISVMTELPSTILQRTRGKNIWIAIQKIYKYFEQDRFIRIVGSGDNSVVDLGKDDINTFSPFSIPEIKNRSKDQVESFLGQQTTTEYIPTNLIYTTKNAKNSNNSIDTIKSKYQQYQKAFKDSTLEYIKKRNQKFSKSVYANKNKSELGNYFQQINNPVGFAFRTSSPNRSLTSSTLQYGIDTDPSNKVVIVDPLSYQIQSYRTPVFRGVTGPAESIAGSDKDINSNFKGNLIKFWIRNLNDDSVMTTPAFISELQDGGGNGTWDQVSYVNTYYPQFIYKGTEKRTITFTLKLACFDKNYLSQYIEKLNFLRTVGFPYYKDVEIPRTNKLGQESNDTSVSTLKVSLAKAPVFALTLGDIVNQQIGYFQACDFTWDDEQTTWNLNPKRMFRSQNISGGDKVLNILNELTNNTAHDSEWELPIVTTITCTFVCMYGRGPSSNYKDDDHYIYDTENLKTARRNLERTNENLSNSAINGVIT